jgi:hypothetical protein
LDKPHPVAVRNSPLTSASRFDNSKMQYRLNAQALKAPALKT